MVIRRTLATLFLSFFILGACISQNKGKEASPKPPRGYRSEKMMKLAYAVGLIDLVDTKPEVPSHIEEFKDITYKQVGDISLQLDVYKRKDLDKNAPVLIFIHGGSWTKGKRSDYLPYLVDFADKGYVTATITYRLSQIAPFPAAVEDAKCAVRWIRTHAQDYMINPEKIAVVGGSAGAHLAMMLAYSDENEYGGNCLETVSSKVQAIVNLYGPTDLTTEYARGIEDVERFMGATYLDDPQVFLSASPKAHISPGDTPTLSFHGTLDSLVPVSQADSLHVWLEKAGVYSEYHRLKGWPHTMDISKKVNEYCQFYMNAFFEKYLRTN
ncbi:MAG: alpha/beta hydrolase [Bacteroidales bacterium]|nr:alpha/beta hydrolase [Bacteroidales bacterium]